MTPLRRLLIVLCAAALAPAVGRAQNCNSSNPADWPRPSRPYFLIVADTSGSMGSAASGAADSCGYGTDRRAHARCAIKNALNAFSGQANFGLSTFPRAQTGCAADCTGCIYGNYPGNATGNGCGAGTGATRAGLFLRVPVQQDSFWTTPSANNVASLMQWVDGSCSSNAELFADGLTPINGALRDARRYLGTGWTAPDGSATYASPLAPQDLAGSGVNGSTGCRSVNVILLIDGDEGCDTQADAVAAATDLYSTGVSVGGKTFKVRVWVVNFAGATVANADAIAAAGGTGSSLFAADEAQLSLALTSIVTGAIHPERCDNVDDDCNGCVDEGFAHYMNVGQTCCAWANPTQRSSCLTTYAATITEANPRGDLTALPCTTASQSFDPATWLCVDPGDACDGVDNDGANGVDEGQVKCGWPPHCPTPEVCNGIDDDCDGQVDEGNVCSGTCLVAPSSEVCDGCDDDCDGLTDDGISVSIPCGYTGPGEPPYCQGTITCKPPQNVAKGACAAGGGYTACAFSATPPPESCDGLDNDCNGVVDDGLPAVPCVPPGTPAGLVYGGTSQCRMGTTGCTDGVTTCAGFVGPSAEVCDGLDNDCDGVVDDGVAGVGQGCGASTPPCSPGVTACVNGALTCVGGVQPAPEVCNGVDDDCNGAVDDGALADGPAPGAEGCWDLPGSCCAFPAAGPTAQWCPPAGASCSGLGVLAGSCRTGVLTCAGAAGWTCAGARGPAVESCNGRDDDCDGVVDAGVTGLGDPCGTDEGECSAGFLACSASGLVCSGLGPTAELCDGKDNDCNGIIDDGIDCGEGDACTRVTCPAGAGCVLRGGGAVCVKTETATSGGCGTAGGAGGGEAALLLAAVALALRRLRGGGARIAPRGVVGAAIAAAALGLSGCGGSTETSKEIEVAPAAVNCTVSNGGVELCDGIDNDCNGVVDDVTAASDPSVGAACQGSPNGACADPAHAGVARCVAGAVVCDGPDVLRPYELAETCNGTDDDCNGVVDDSPVDAGASCGTGDFPPCVRGALQCQSGALVCVGAVLPQPETCNGIDDDCDGVVDDNLPASQSGDACGARPAPPGGATSPCSAGIRACVDGAVVCQGAVGPTSALDTCGVDANCDGELTQQPDLLTDVHNCGACGNDCGAGSVHAAWACVPGAGTASCVFQGCQPGWYDNGGPGDAAAGDHACGYACTFASAKEVCNGKDDNCDGQIDEPASLLVPAPSQVCGVSPASSAPECTPYDVGVNPGGVSVACVGGSWSCTFHTAGVCSPSCANAVEICETSGPALDNDCDGAVNENVPDWGQPCASDDGLPAPGHGPCRTAGTKVCASATSTTCSAAKNPAAAGPELCDGVDNDCDGLVDEPFTAKGGNATYFVKPAVTRIGASLWIYSYEASRPTATAVSPGAGNGYHCLSPGCGAGIPGAPAGVTLDKTAACSVANRLPWSNVSPTEAEQTCAAMGGHVCSTSEWQAACGASVGCTWGFGAYCTTFNANTCNLGAFDFDAAAPGDQDGLLPAASASLPACWADWSGLQGNTSATGKVYDVTGNVREISKSAPGDYRLMGGSYLSQVSGGATCGFTGYAVDQGFRLADTGFRCCFDADPGL